MPLVYRITADVVMVVHVAYVLFVIGGLLLTIVGGQAGWKWVRNRWFRGVHLAMIGIVVFETWLGITCPLSVWEWQLREWAGQATYRGDFIAKALDSWLFYDFPEWVFTAGYTTFGLAVAATWAWLPPTVSQNERPGLVEQPGSQKASSETIAISSSQGP